MSRFQMGHVDKFRGDELVVMDLPVIYDSVRGVAAPFPPGYERAIQWEFDNTPESVLVGKFLYVEPGVRQQMNGMTYDNLRLNLG